MCAQQIDGPIPTSIPPYWIQLATLLEKKIEMGFKKLPPEQWPPESKFETLSEYTGWDYVGFLSHIAAFKQGLADIKAKLSPRYITDPEYNEYLVHYGFKTYYINGFNSN